MRSLAESHIHMSIAGDSERLMSVTSNSIDSHSTLGTDDGGRDWMGIVAVVVVVRVGFGVVHSVGTGHVDSRGADDLFDIDDKLRPDLLPFPMAGVDAVVVGVAFGVSRCRWVVWMVLAYPIVVDWMLSLT